MLDLMMMSRMTCPALRGTRANIKPSEIEQLVLFSHCMERKRSKAPVMPRRGRAVITQVSDAGPRTDIRSHNRHVAS